jgi:hypothetical protein
MFKLLHLGFSGITLILCGWSIVAYTMREIENSSSVLKIKGCIAILVGVGVWSASYSLLLFLHLTGIASLLIKDAALIAGSLWLLKFSRSKTQPRLILKDTNSNEVIPPWLRIWLFFALGVTFTLFVLGFFQTPHGAWDAWATWNMHARFLHRAPDDLTLGFLPHMTSVTHTNYPLGLPGLVAQIWTILGSDTIWVPGMIGWLYAALTLILIFYAIQLLGAETNGFLSILLLTSTPIFISLAVIQYADVLIAAYILSAIILMVISLKHSKLASSRLFLLAGILFSIALWMKNEGVVHLLILTTAWFVGHSMLHSPKEALKKFRVAAAGMLPLICLYLYFKGTYATVNQYRDTLGHYAAKLFDLNRIQYLAGEAFKHLATFDKWSLHAFFVLAAWIFLLRNLKSVPFYIRVPAFATFISILSFYVIMLIIPYDLTFQINTNMDRLFAQNWPTLIFLTFLALPPLLPFKREFKFP